MKILELTGFSAGICGVWSRVREESLRLSKNDHKVVVFSSDFVKGTNERAKREDKIGNVLIRRFPAKKLGGESFMSWNFEGEALKFAPDVIIVHCYRHTHTIEALKIASRLRKMGRKCKVILVTHAPFERGSSRSLPAKIAVWHYDKFVAPKTINHFDKIVAITKWEIPYLLKIGADKRKIEYIPNGIPEEFFRQKKGKEENKILFLGRISPIKSIETLISAMRFINDKRIILDIVGPAEESYLKELKGLVVKLGFIERVIFSGPVFDIEEKIKKIDSAKIFVLPSKSEGMPQSLIEAMARGKIVIASATPAAKDLIVEGKDGFLFEIENARELAHKVNIVLDKNNSAVKMEAKRSVERFKWSSIISKIEKVIK